jgi:hypothetical protein
LKIKKGMLEIEQKDIRCEKETNACEKTSLLCSDLGHRKDEAARSDASPAAAMETSKTQGKVENVSLYCQKANLK